jgi:hypothetical protein
MTPKQRRRAVILAGALVAGAVTASSAAAATYYNARYGYSVTYPADILVPEPVADAGDGRRFHVNHGSASMAVWASYNAMNDSPAEIERSYKPQCAGGKITYETAKPRLVALSCITQAGRVLYFKTLIQGTVLTTITFDYALADRATWDSRVAKIAGSLTAGTLVNYEKAD